jgi:hypothetical protein
MSRWTPDDRDDRDDERTTGSGVTLEVHRGAAGTEANRQARRDRPRPAVRRREAVNRPPVSPPVPLRELRALVESVQPVTLAHDRRTFELSPREVRGLATIGTFRAIPVEDLSDRALLSRDELSGLRNQGLITLDEVGLRGDTRAIAALTRTGQELLEAHRSTDRSSSTQAFHAGIVKPAELAHDVEAFALYEIVAHEIEQRGGTVDRVVLDYELKSDYQSYLNRADREAGTTLEADRAAWAVENHLRLVDGELHLPDFRIEYHDRDGQPQHQDVEYVTRHYAAKAIAAKGKAGFAVFRRPPSGSGSVPDPRLFERLV